MKQKYMVAILLTWSILLVACAQQKAEIAAEDQMMYEHKGVTLQISKRDMSSKGINQDPDLLVDDEQGMMRIIKQLNTPEEVSAVMDILNHTSYIKAKLEMTRPPDYEIGVISDDSLSSAYSIVFGLWLSTDQETYAVVDQTNYRHGRLSAEDSQTMIKLLE